MGEVLIQQGWEGRSIDGKMPLLEYLGGAGDRGVFLTVRQGTQRAAIKLFVAGGAESDAYLAQWEAARTISHPHLMPALEFGRSNLDGVDLVYIVTERADDNLAHILKDRAIEPSEARSIFDPIVGALAFLHDHSVIHGHVKPTNIFKVAGKWKLASDDLWQAGGIIKQVGYPDEYNAPEALDHRLSPAVDSWSMGMTLAEALTQQRPKWNWSNGGSPAIPGTLPQGLSRAVLECLRVDPQDRCTITQLRLRLESVAEAKKPEPAPEEAPAARAVSLFVPIHEVPAVEKESQPTSTAEKPIPDATAADSHAQSQPAAATPEAPTPQERSPQATVEEKPAGTAGDAEQKTEPAASSTTATSTKAPDANATRHEEVPRRAEDQTAASANARPLHDKPSTEEAQHEVPFESSRPRPGRMLFALGDYEADEEERPKKRVWPWVLGGVFVLGGAAYLGVHFGTGSPPTSSISQNAPSSGQPTAQTQPTPQPQNQPAAQQPAPPQSAPAPTEPGGSQTAQPATQPQQAAQPTANTAPPAPASSAPAAQAPATTTNPTPVQAAKDKSVTASPSGSEQAKTMEGVSRPPKPRGASGSQNAAEGEQAARPPNANGEVRDRVVPNVSPAARSSMRRSVEVEIRVAVDRLGKVERVEYMDHGPGNYFARTAYRAAHEWRFAPPLRNGQPQASVWMLTFSFTRRNTEVTATEEDR